MRIKSTVNKTYYYSFSCKTWMCINSQGCWKNYKIVSTLHRKMGTYFRQDSLFENNLNMIIIHTATANTILFCPLRVMLFDAFYYCPLIINMKTIQQFIYCITAQRTNYFFAPVHTDDIGKEKTK